MVAGDGRFNNKLLELANTVTAIDIDSNELQQMKDNCRDDYTCGNFLIISSEKKD